MNVKPNIAQTTMTKRVECPFLIQRKMVQSHCLMQVVSCNPLATDSFIVFTSYQMKRLKIEFDWNNKHNDTIPF